MKSEHKLQTLAHADTPADSIANMCIHKFKQRLKNMHNQVCKHTCTFICYTGGVTEAAAVTEGFNGGVLITERLHISMLPPWEKKERHGHEQRKYNSASTKQNALVQHSGSQLCNPCAAQVL